MSRLTVNDLDKVAYSAWELCGMDADCTADCEGCFVNAIYLKLAHYEDLEEQGRLIELPCSLGDIVYVIWCTFDGFNIRETQITSIKWFPTGWYFETGELMPAFKPKDFGERIFTTKEEAEAKLAELKGTEE